MSANTKNYFDGEQLVLGDLRAPIANQAASTATAVTGLKSDFNDLLIKLKDAGIMAGDAITLTVANSVTDSEAGHADRTYNTGKISSVAEANGIITITLSDKVANLKDFDAKNGWGVHKWLGIAVAVSGITDITKLTYNGGALTADDVSEATAMGLSSGYFVRWVAADLVLAGDNTQKSKGRFVLGGNGLQKTEYLLKIVEG